MKMRVIALAGVLLLLVTSSGTLAAAEAKTVRLLTVGNSFSRNATRYLTNLVEAGGHKLVHQPIVVGGASMELHAKKFQDFESDPAKTNGYYSGKRSLKQHLLAEKWDYVTIQQASIKSHDLGTYQPFAGQLRDYIKQHAPQAQLMVHQTWAYRVDDPRFKVAKPKEGEPKTQAEMYEGLSKAYKTITAELGAKRLPVGDAFYIADTETKWGYKTDAKFDAKKATAPELPDQTHSLHVGWKWAKGKDGKMTLGMDGHHANLAGEYLGACVWYEVLFGESAVGNKFIPKGLDAEYAKFLQETAHKAVTQMKQEKSK
jgi:hypothetical protein